MCHTLPLSFLDRPGSEDIGFAVQSLNIGDSFAPSALTFLPLVTSSIGLALIASVIGETRGGGVFLPLALVYVLGLGLASLVRIMHFLHLEFCLISNLLRWARGASVPTCIVSGGCG